jgi:hypothetical protein
MLIDVDLAAAVSMSLLLLLSFIFEERVRIRTQTVFGVIAPGVALSCTTTTALSSTSRRSRASRSRSIEQAAVGFVAPLCELSVQGLVGTDETFLAGVGTFAQLVRSTAVETTTQQRPYIRSGVRRGC